MQSLSAARSVKSVKQIIVPSGKAALSTLLAALVLALNGLAASPVLHELLHADADHVSHACSVTLFSHGQIDSSSGEVAAAVPTALIKAIPCRFFSYFPSGIAHLPPGRAPPPASSLPA